MLWKQVMKGMNASEVIMCIVKLSFVMHQKVAVNR